jgi:hypothetical protein
VADCLDLVLAAPGGEKAVSDYLQRIDQKRAKAIVAAGRLHQVALDRVAEEREWAVKRLKGYWAQLIADVEAKFSPFVEDEKSKAEVLKAELKKAGVVVA